MTIPQPSPPPPAAPTASSSGASPAPDAAAVQVQGALAANTVRFQFLMDRLDALFKGKIQFKNSDFVNLIFSLAKAIDYSLASNNLPAVALHLPSAIKQVYQRRHEGDLHTAIMVLMISVKNACKNGWFNPIAAEELLSMTNEFCNSFCIALSSASAVGRATEIVSHVIQRFYPQLKLCHLVVSFEVKPGYETLVADFLIPRNISPQERIRLFVVHTDSVETSACIISPPQVSFLVNGKGVERRTNVSLDNGPQFPTDITKMLKYGMNMMQAIGYFSGTYIIAIAFTRSIEIATPTLSDYIQPLIESPNSDSELIVGASRISINCPISFRRIKTPVKGHLCKHQQCFDYDNFMEMNSRKPSWRCPCCNQPVSCIDLRIDQNMDKILGEVADDITDVVISADGSWKAIAAGNGDTDEQRNGPTEGKNDNNLEHGSDSTNMVTEVMDLTMEEDGEHNAAQGARQGCVSSTTSHCNAPAYESEDRKPFKDIQGLPTSEFYMESAVSNSTSSNTQLTAHVRGYGIWSTMSSSTSSTNGSSSISTAPNAHAIGTLESLVPNVVLNPVMTDAISPAVYQESGTAPQASHATLHLQQASQVNQLPENMQLLQARYGNSIVSNGIERPPIPRHVSRTPIAVQALPVQTQMPPLRMRTNVINSSAVTSSSSSPSYQVVPSEQATSSLQHSRPQLFSAQNHQNQLHSQHSRNPIALQQIVGLAASNLSGTRTSTSVQGVYRLASQTPVNGQTPYHQPSNTRVRHTASQVTATHSQSSHISSMHAQQASQSNASLSVGSSMSSQSQLLAARRAALTARLQTTVTPSQAWKTASSTPLPTDGLRLPGSNILQNVPLGMTLPQTHRTASSTPLPTDGPRVDQLQSVATGATTAARTDVVSLLPSGQNWRPTGRMRGSLTGTAYATALSHYASAPNQPVVSRPMASVVAPISDKMATLNSMDTHGPQTQRAYTNNAEIGSQPRYPSTL